MLLALDTATPLVTVALHDDRSVVAELSSTERLRHGEQLAPLIASALDQVGITRAELTGVAVGVGPGPFTGLRVGLVTARTLGWALGVPVHGVCTLDVLALEAVETDAVRGDGPDGRDQGPPGFVVATDARRREVYVAAYDPSGRRVAGPVVDRPAEVATDKPVVGEGAALYPEAFPRAVGPVRPSAAWLARAVVERRVELLDPAPLYLRRPDAAMPGPRKPAS